MADSDQTKSEYAAAEKHGNFSVPRFSLFEASQPWKRFGKTLKYSFLLYCRKSRKEETEKQEEQRDKERKEKSSAAKGTFFR